MLKKDGHVIWPIYFDRSTPRSKCRRVPDNLAIKNPNAEQIAAAAKKLGWRAEIEPGSHPALWWRKTGKVLVKPDKPMKKNEVIRRLAVALRSMSRR